MNKNSRVQISLAFLFIFICFIIYLIFILGSNYVCNKSGGILVNNNEGIRCIDIDNLDLCINDDSKLDKQKPRFNFNYTIIP